MDPNPGSKEHFELLGADLMGRSGDTLSDQFLARWTTHFQVSPAVVARAWGMILPQLVRGAHPVHLLWALLFLKQYAKESVLSGMCCVDEDTFRKWTWLIIPLLADLEAEVVSFSSVSYFYDTFLLICFYSTCFLGRFSG